ncbi:hypothetical protein MXD62_37515 [Frankia sp. Mgl5]|uniref:hypothetical protein n=1 Tax=Frankia sp. Mgl5 TaxID=2933793 RepID=UPI00200D7FE5|nr:hypothetical protein [Frankia sp. Mgl5]MCK9932775.1 hypothetical protein [Frankia sp. Mgl5]
MPLIGSKGQFRWFEHGSTATPPPELGRSAASLAGRGREAGAGTEAGSSVHTHQPLESPNPADVP